VPELPELEAHAERLEAAFGGAVLERFQPLSFTALKTAVPSPDEAYGHALVGVRRRGKHLLLDFGGLTFVVHLMQGGRLRVDDKQSLKPRNGHARFKFADGRALLLTEAGTEKRAGVWAITGVPETQPPLDHLGPDADAEELDASKLLELLHANPMRLHGWLRDQRIVAGVGRRLANEVCHRAKMSPFANTGRMDAADADRLAGALTACISESLAYERTRDDMSNSADRPGAVHHRDGQGCPVCGDTVRAVEYRTYTVNYCPTCQTGGKVLADNTTSKFLK
jgi:formamidopyrimidine-DNA glycosylase